MTRSEVFGRLSETEWKVWMMLEKRVIVDYPHKFMARLWNSFVFLKARIMLGGVDPVRFVALTTASCTDDPEWSFTYSECYNWLKSLRLF